jgi:hypothetical protein
MTVEFSGDEHPDDTSVDHDRTVAYEPPVERADVRSGPQIAGSFRYALVAERGPRAGLTHVLGAGTTLAGRADDVAIFLGDVTVSRHHARFLVDDAGLSMEDLGSTNGTYVNLRRVERAQLAPGDEVIIGKFHLMVVRGDG